MPADPFDGLDVGKTVTGLFEELKRSESTKKVGETSKKVEIGRFLSLHSTHKSFLLCD